MERLGPIIATVTHPTVREQARSARKALSQGAQTVEYRVDSLSPGEDPEGLLTAAALPALFSGSRDRIKPGEPALFKRAQEAGAWVDLPWSADLPADLFGLDPAHLVLSFHDVEGTPPHLHDVLGAMRQRPAAAYKIVPTAMDFPDVVAIKGFLDREGGPDLCAFAMGAAGLPSRVLAVSWGSFATYAAAPGCEAAAPGQVGLAELLSVFDPLGIERDTPIYGLVGWPLKTTRSPALFNAWLRAAGLPGRYLPFPASDCQAFLTEERLPLAGVAVTTPHKEAVLASLARTSRLVRALGACNTVILEDDGLAGANTDVHGVRRAVASVPQGSRSLIFGIGGAAAAAALALKAKGPCAVTGRDPDRTRAFARRFGLKSVAWEKREATSWDLLVNATPVGQEGPDLPLPPESLGGRWLLEMVVRAGGTPLARAAVERGLEVFPGESMLVPQARLQFRLWTGRRAPGRGGGWSEIEGSPARRYT